MLPLCAFEDWHVLDAAPVQGWRRRLHTMVVGMRNVPIGSCIWTFDLQLMVQFGEVMEILGGTALLM